MRTPIVPQFSSRGEVNASDRADLMNQLVRYAEVLASGSQPAEVNGLQRRADQYQYTDKQKEALLARALDSERGRRVLGQVMENPIRESLDYRGVGRKALVVDPLPTGALAVYDKDIDVTAVIVSSNGAVPESRIKGERVEVPDFEVVANPTVRIREVKIRRFNVIDRAQAKARQTIQEQEDSNSFAALDAASTIVNTATTVVGSLSKVGLNNAVREVDKWDLVTASIFMNIRQFADLRLWDDTDLDPVTRREVLETGLFARIWTSNIIVSKKVPAGTIYTVADPEFTGVMPVRQDIEVIPADEPRLLKLGWVVSEIIGTSIVNSRSVSKITVT